MVGCSCNSKEARVVSSNLSWMENVYDVMKFCILYIWYRKLSEFRIAIQVFNCNLHYSNTYIWKCIYYIYVRTNPFAYTLLICIVILRGTKTIQLVTSVRYWSKLLISISCIFIFTYRRIAKLIGFVDMITVDFLLLYFFFVISWK